MPDEAGDIVVTARLSSPNTVNISPGNNYFFYADGGAFSNPNSMADALFNGQFEVSAGTAPPVADEGEIVVTASKEQVDAAMFAFDVAGMNLTITKYLGIIATSLASKVAGALIGVVDETIDLNSDAVQNAYADLLYMQDGADGSYDGYAQEMGEYQSFFPGSSGPGPKTPPMPSEMKNAVGDADFQQAVYPLPDRSIEESAYNPDINFA